MSDSCLRRLLPVASVALLIAWPVAWPSGAAAQTVPRPQADPLDPAASVPRLVYRSSLRDLPRLTEQPVASWRAANDAVTRIGGWRSYLREAQQPESAASAPAAGAAASGSRP